MSSMCHAQATKFSVSSKHLFNSHKIHVTIYIICLRSLKEGKGGKVGMRRTFVTGPFSHPRYRQRWTPHQTACGEPGAKAHEEFCSLIGRNLNKSTGPFFMAQQQLFYLYIYFYMHTYIKYTCILSNEYEKIFFFQFNNKKLISHGTDFFHQWLEWKLHCH